MLFAATQNKPNAAAAKRLLANKAASLIMIPIGKKSPRQAPQSPLMANQNSHKRNNIERTKTNKNARSKMQEIHYVTPKITSTPVCQDFYWGKRVNSKTKLTARMLSLQTVFGLDYCKSTKVSAASCLLHCEWARFLIEDLQDLESAAEFYSFSADMGHARSMHKLAIMLLYGRGVPHNPKRARYFLVKLLNAGSDHITTTYYNCMCAFLPSPGLHPSANVTKEALQKMRTSVTKGLDYHLNHPWNKVLAIKTDEIKKCMAQALLVLGRHYLRKSIDVGSALEWLIESSKLGNADAMCTIGDAFTFQTSGTVQNIPLARKYYKLAAAFGNKKAERRIASLKDWE